MENGVKIWSGPQIGPPGGGLKWGQLAPFLVFLKNLKYLFSIVTYNDKKPLLSIPR